MNLMEYQGKELFRRSGIPRRADTLATRPTKSRRSSKANPGSWVIKAKCSWAGAAKPARSSSPRSPKKGAKLQPSSSATPAGTSESRRRGGELAAGRGKTRRSRSRRTFRSRSIARPRNRRSSSAPRAAWTSKKCGETTRARSHSSGSTRRSAFALQGAAACVFGEPPGAGYRKAFPAIRRRAVRAVLRLRREARRDQPARPHQRRARDRRGREGRTRRRRALQSSRVQRVEERRPDGRGSGCGAGDRSRHSNLPSSTATSA